MYFLHFDNNIYYILNCNCGKYCIDFRKKHKRNGMETESVVNNTHFIQNSNHQRMFFILLYLVLLKTNYSIQTTFFLEIILFLVVFFFFVKYIYFRYVTNTFS